MYNSTQTIHHEEHIINFLVDDEGFLINPEDWSELFAENILGLAPSHLNPEYLKAIYFIRDKYLRLGALPPMRQVCKSVNMEKSELKNIFGTCLQLWKASGLPRPDDELRSYMN